MSCRIMKRKEFLRTTKSIRNKTYSNGLRFLKFVFLTPSEQSKIFNLNHKEPEFL